MAKIKQFVPGDRVAYSVAWLKSTGTRTGIMPQLRGTVREVQAFGGNQLCVIAWDNYQAPSQYHDDGRGRVIAPNLTRISRSGSDSALNT